MIVKRDQCHLTSTLPFRFLDVHFDSNPALDSALQMVFLLECVEVLRSAGCAEAAVSLTEITHRDYGFYLQALLSSLHVF